MESMILRCRKYFNESRYPYASDVSIYTKEFAAEFIEFITIIKDYIDNDCLATVEDLKDRYTNKIDGYIPNVV
jgi:hypothetical protein